MSDGVIDLAGQRAARREGKANEIRVRLGEGDPCVLPVELPVDALSPLKALDLDKDLGLLFQSRSTEQGEQIVRDLITIRPQLAGDLLDAGKGCLERLFCSCATPPWERPERRDETTQQVVEEHHDDACQWPAFLKWRPSPQDYVALIRGLWTAYGADLGKAFEPSGSSGSDGTKSKQTSPATTGSTPAESGSAPAPTGS